MFHFTILFTISQAAVIINISDLLICFCSLEFFLGLYLKKIMLLKICILYYIVLLNSGFFVMRYFFYFFVVVFIELFFLLVFLDLFVSILFNNKTN